MIGPWPWFSWLELAAWGSGLVALFGFAWWHISRQARIRREHDEFASTFMRMNAERVVQDVDAFLDPELAEMAELADQSIQAAIAEGQHATCRFDEKTMGDFLGKRIHTHITQHLCAWSGPVAALVRHGVGDYRCPNGHGGNWLAFHAAGVPAVPLPPRWAWQCAICGMQGDADHPIETCFGCGMPLTQADRR